MYIDTYVCMMHLHMSSYTYVYAINYRCITKTIKYNSSTPWHRRRGTKKAAKWLAFVDDRSEANPWHRLSAQEGLEDGKKMENARPWLLYPETTHVIRV